MFKKFLYWLLEPRKNPFESGKTVPRLHFRPFTSAEATKKIIKGDSYE